MFSICSSFVPCSSLILIWTWPYSQKISFLACLEVSYSHFIQTFGILLVIKFLKAFWYIFARLRTAKKKFKQTKQTKTKTNKDYFLAVWPRRNCNAGCDNANNADNAIIMMPAVKPTVSLFNTAVLTLPPHQKISSLARLEVSYSHFIQTFGFLLVVKK